MTGTEGPEEAEWEYEDRAGSKDAVYGATNRVRVVNPDSPYFAQHGSVTAVYHDNPAADASQCPILEVELDNGTVILVAASSVRRAHPKFDPLDSTQTLTNSSTGEMAMTFADPWGDMARTIEVKFPVTDWKPNDDLEDPTASLRGPTLVLNGLPMHMEAWAVSDEDGLQQATDEYAEDFEKLYAAVHADGSFSTTVINGREYIVVIHPHC